ncbi:hypothetical protein ACF3DV_29450 [Chlorogloeopsis fritschii PCC 9212]|uniref:hypothetical protein n=1 Tax=Chlorogloeopsis fritschii TaxID=1124 RepID=UPI000308A741|nr:hypothetical protein [Chlorogloeopsis fritschii]
MPRRDISHLGKGFGIMQNYFTPLNQQRRILKSLGLNKLLMAQDNPYAEVTK